MAKIIPWSLPSITGGSQGGYTPAPTPPQAEYPYNFDDVVLSRNAPAYGSKRNDLKLNFSDIVVNDVIGITNIVFMTTCRLSTTSQADADAGATQVMTRTITSISSWVSNPNGWFTLITQEMTEGTAYYFYLDSLTINVIGSDGQIVQSETFDLTGLNA